jgi:low temperature requirement protein LtrA
MSKRRFWELPELNYQEELGEHRKVTWLELFFDLFFVVSIAQLAHRLSGNPSWGNIVDFVLMFIPIWWVWVGFTYYNERFESNGLENRFVTFLIMLTVIGLAVFGHHGPVDGFSGFAFFYAMARLILIMLWLRVSLHVPSFRPTGVRLITGFSLSVALTLIAAFVGIPFGYKLFGIALVIDLLTPFTTAAHQKKLPSISSSKMPERYGLFIIIVLGETIVGVVNGVASVHNFTVQLFIESAFAVAIGFSFWWIYFDYIGRLHHRKGPWWMFAWVYLHLPLVVAIVATGASIASVLGGGEEFSEVLQQIIASSVGVFLFAVAGLETTLYRQDGEPTHKYFSPMIKLCAGFLCLAAGWADIISSFFWLLLVLLALLSSQMAYGAWVQRNNKIESIGW